MSHEARHTESIGIRWSDTGPGGILKSVSYLDYCMEAADAHAVRLGFAMTDIANAGLYWVLARYRLRFAPTRPRIRDVVNVVTWPRGWKRLLVFREFAVFDQAESELARATSAWLLVRKDSFRPARPQTTLAGMPTSSQAMVSEEAKALAAPDNAVPASNVFPVTHDDIDFLSHVSNVRYARWAIDAVPEAICTERCLREFDIDYNGMAFLGQTVQVHLSPIVKNNGEVELTGSIQHVEEDRELTRFRMLWQ